jgi:hypothetical protein
MRKIMKLQNTISGAFLRRAIAIAAPAVLMAGTLTGCGYDDRYEEHPHRVTRVERVETVYQPQERVVVQEQPVYEPPPTETVVETVYEPAPVEVITTYETDLRPYGGQWVETREYGRCWVPARRPHGWRPYTVGRWEYTDQRQWAWVSEGDETGFGVVTYHYGRWYEDPYHGWVWVPGSTWAPAWVSWREGGGYAGWAPLPPRVRDGYRVTTTVDRYIPNDRYVFVEQRYMASPRIHEHVVQNNVTIINQTTNITNITYVNNRVVNRGVDVVHVEQASQKKIQPVKTVQVTSRTQATALVQQGKPVIYEPPVIHKAAVQTQEKVKVEYKKKEVTNKTNTPPIPNNGQPISPVDGRRIDQQQHEQEAKLKAQQAERDRIARERKIATENAGKPTLPADVHQVDPNKTAKPILPADVHQVDPNKNVNPNKNQPPKNVVTDHPSDARSQLLLEQQKQQEELRKQKEHEAQLKKERDDARHQADLKKQQEQEMLRKQKEVMSENLRKQQEQENLRKQKELQLQQQEQLKKQHEQDLLKKQHEQALLKKQQEEAEIAKQKQRELDQKNTQIQNNTGQKVSGQNGQPTGKTPKDPKDPKDPKKDPNNPANQ